MTCSNTTTEFVGETHTCHQPTSHTGMHSCGSSGVNGEDNEGDDVSEQTRTCLIPGCGKGTPRVAKIGYMCGFHHRKHTEILHEIPDAYASLTIERIQAGSSEVKVKHKEPPAPINLDALSLLDPRSSAPGQHIDGNDLPNVIEALYGWCRVVHEDIGGVSPSSDMTSMAFYLDRHGDYIATQAWVDEYWTELQDCSNVLLRVSRHERPRKIGRCYLDWKDDVCNGPLIQQPGTLHTKCQRCAQEWKTPRERAVLAVALRSSTKFSTSTGEANESAPESQTA